MRIRLLDRFRRWLRADITTAVMEELRLFYRDAEKGLASEFNPNKGWVFAANRQVAGRAARAKIQLHRSFREKATGPDGRPLSRAMTGDEWHRVPVHSHPILDLLASPNADETGLVFRWRQILHLQNQGLFYVAAFPQVLDVKQPDGKGLTLARIGELRLLRAEKATPESGDGRAIKKVKFKKKDGSDDEFKIAPRGEPEIAAWRENPYEFAFPVVFPGVALGDSPAGAARVAIDNLRALGILHSNQLENGIHAGLVFYLLTQTEDPKRFELAMMLLKAGLGKAGEPLVLPKHRVEVDKSPVSNQEMQFKELAELSRQEALATLGASDGMVGMSAALNRATIWGMEHIMAVGTVDPLNDLIADAYNAFLLPLYPGQSASNYLELGFTSAKLVDPRDEASVEKMLVESGIKTANEARETLGHPPHPDGDRLGGKKAVQEAPAEQGGGTSPPAPSEVEEEVSGEERSDPSWIWMEDGDGRDRATRDLNTEEGRAAIWEELMRGFAEIEASFEEEVSRLFGEMERDILKKLTAFGKDIMGEQVERSRGERQHDALNLLFNPEDWDDAFRALYQEHGFRAVLEGAKDVFDEVGLDEAFAVTDPRVQMFVTSRAFEFVTQISETTRKQLSERLDAAFQEGIGPIEFGHRIETLFEGFKGARSVTIARTEMNAASNWGRDQAMIDSAAKGVKMKKMWVSTRGDGKTRETHVRADGQVREVDMPFQVGGCQMMHPLDGGMCPLAEEIVNCRCRHVPVVL